MNIVPIKQLEVIDYDAFPKDSYPRVTWPQLATTQFSKREASIIAWSILGSQAIALFVHIAFDWSIRACVPTFYGGVLLAGAFSYLAAAHYLAFLAHNPSVMRKRFGKSRGFRVCFAKLRVKQFSNTYIYLLLAFLFVIFVICNSVRHVPDTFNESLHARLKGYFGMLFTLPLFPIAIFYIAGGRDSWGMRATHLTRVLCLWFADDMPSSVPYAFRSPAGPLPFRLAMFVLPLFLLCLSLPWMMFYAPIVPATLGEETMSDLILSHPFSRLPEFQGVDVLRPGEGVNAHAFVADEPSAEDWPSKKADKWQAAYGQRLHVLYASNGWLQALPRFSMSHPILGVLGLLLSLLFSALLVIETFLASAIFWITERGSIAKAYACYEAMLENDWWESTTHLLCESQDRYESESIYLGQLEN